MVANYGNISFLYLIWLIVMSYDSLVLQNFNSIESWISETPYVQKFIIIIIIIILLVPLCVSKCYFHVFSSIGWYHFFLSMLFPSQKIKFSHSNVFFIYFLFAAKQHQVLDKWGFCYTQFPIYLNGHIEFLKCTIQLLFNESLP